MNNWEEGKPIPIYLNLAKGINLKEAWDKLFIGVDIKITIGSLSK